MKKYTLMLISSLALGVLLVSCPGTGSGAPGTGDGYTFGNAGTMGDGTGDTDQHPVTTVNWRDAMVWNNAPYGTPGARDPGPKARGHAQDPSAPLSTLMWAFHCLMAGEVLKCSS